jgi:hypothetical protein
MAAAGDSLVICQERDIKRSDVRPWGMHFLEAKKYFIVDPRNGDVRLLALGKEE